MSIYKKLNAARDEFHRLSLKKTGRNNFAKYSYFELSDFVIPALEVFSKHGLCAVTSFGVELAQMAVVEVEGDGQIIFTSPMGSAALKGCHEVQNIGAVETYQRRYLWMAALEIVEHDALDSSEGAVKAPKKLLPSVKAMHEALDEEDPTGMREVWDELTKDEQSQVWLEFKTAQKTKIKALLHESTKGDK